MDIIMDTPEFQILPEHLKLISEIDEFKGKWQMLRNLAPDQLSLLKRIATIESIGSSTRIEGAGLTDSEVERLLSGLNTTSFESRDEAEVAGYAEAMEMIFESYDEIQISENHIKQLHQVLLRFTSKDARHRGEYKKLPNHVEAFAANGRSLGIIFETASPFDTPFRMKELIQWLREESQKGTLHPLLLMAIFIVHFLAIHPFQDGNGRLSRILTTLLLMRSGYSYVPFSSLERIVEENKDRYYLSLRRAQSTLYTNNSKLNDWFCFSSVV
jgi:Fic family protein